MGCTCATSQAQAPRPAEAPGGVEHAVAGSEARKALALLDGVVGGRGINAIVSFPGKYQDAWNDMVATVKLLQYLAQKLHLGADEVPPILSTACIFLPDGHEDLGKHHLNNVDPVETQAGHCFCHKLYGEPKPWGCEWFYLWQEKLEDVLDKGQKPVVVYKADEVGQGDSTTWEQFPIPFSTEHRGLGGSQKGEVAYLRRRLAERGLHYFEKKDVNDVSGNISHELFGHLGRIIKGPEGGAAVADALECCAEVQEGLGTLTLAGVNLGEVGAALARSLPCLRALQKLEISYCGLGREGGRALAASLQRLPKLTSLNLAVNGLGEEGGTELAANLRYVPWLEALMLHSNDLGEEGGKALAANLHHLPALKELGLSFNQLGEEAGHALAAGLHHLPQLEKLYLWDCGLQEGTGLALAASLQHLPRLRVLVLEDNDLGEHAKRQLRQQWRGKDDDLHL